MALKQLIQPEDFRSANVQISLRNLTTATVVDAKVKTIGNFSIGHATENNQIQLLEILPKGPVLSVPRYTCATGHILEVHVQVAHLGNAPFDASLLGSVKDIENASKEADRIELELKSGSVKQWADFCGLFAERQKAIHEFFYAARGYR